MNIKRTIITMFTIITTILQAAGTLSPVNSGLKPAEIVSHDVVVTINNGFAQTEVSQQFKNINDTTMEAIYSFPVPQSASLADCQVQIGEQTMNGEVVAKDKAKQVYEEEKNAGNNAGVADKNGYQDFSFKIANLAPQDTATITFTYYQPLPVDTGVCRYQYPLEEGNTNDAGAMGFWERNDKPTGKATVRVILRSAWPVTAYRAPQGTVASEQADLTNGTADITYELTEGLTKDFVFYYSLANNLPGRLEVIPFKRNGEDGTFMMVLTPGIDLKPITNGADYVFVLDKSGSMCGGKIQTLAKGVAKTIQKMNANDRFRIITFNHNAEDITGGYIPATPENIQKAVAMLDTVQANGSTNLYDGLKTALMKLDDDRVTSLVIVTDGVTNTGEVNPKAFAKMMARNDIRVFGFLMGNSCNWPLMRTICDVSGGFYDAVSNDDDIIGKIMLAKSKITSEAMHDVKVSINGIKTYDVTKDCVKKLYRGQQLVMFGRYKDHGEATVTMKTRISGEDKTYTCKMTFPEQDEDNPELERMFAIAQIEMHEDMVNQGLEDQKENTDFVRGIGLKYQIVTDETSLIMLTDEQHAKHSIERHNQKRVQAERTAQAQRKTQPVKNYRVDAPRPTSPMPANSPAPQHSNGMFQYHAPHISHGGGAMDVWTVIIIAAMGAVAARYRKQNQ